jgi:hypothetical protein
LELTMADERAQSAIKNWRRVSHRKVSTITISFARPRASRTQTIGAANGAYADLALSDNGNPVCNNIPYVYRPLTADWMNEKLAA